MTAKLNVNIDHVATVRQARRTIEPSLVAAAMICEAAGADGITIHLRQDRRHIQDADIKILRQAVTTYLNVELAATDEMINIAVEHKPEAVSLVPENPNEVTTEGGLDVAGNFQTIKTAIERLRDAGIFASVFIDPDKRQIEAAHNTGAQQIEICTAEYAELTLSSRSAHGAGALSAAQEIKRIDDAASFAGQFGLVVAAGHGLTVRNIKALAQITEIKEFNIGHSIISRSIFVGLDAAVREMIRAIG